MFLPFPDHVNILESSAFQVLFHLLQCVGISAAGRCQHVNGENSAGRGEGPGGVHDVVPNQNGPALVETLVNVSKEVPVSLAAVAVYNCG